MANKTDRKYLRTPFAVAKFCYLNRPDRGYNADGVYSVTIELDIRKPKHKAFLAELKAYAAEHFSPAQIKSKDFFWGFKPKRVSDEDGNVTVDKNIFDLKLQNFREVPFYDIKGTEIPKSVNIGGGSQLALDFTLEPKTSKPGLMTYLNTVRVGTLVTYTTKSAGDGSGEDLSDEFEGDLDDAYVVGDEAEAEAPDTTEDEAPAKTKTKAAKPTAADLDDDLPF